MNMKNTHNQICEECYVQDNRCTPLLNKEKCLKEHTQYICGTCGRCICFEEDKKRGVMRFNYPFKDLQTAKMYLRCADVKRKSPQSIYKFRDIKNDRIFYKIYGDIDEVNLYLKKNKDKELFSETPQFKKEKYIEYKQTQIRKLTQKEIEEYLK